MTTRNARCPGLLAPLQVGERKLVDGGLVDNVPIREVRERCGAEVVIAVNVGSPLLKAEDVTGLLTVTAQVVALLTEQNVAQSLATLTPNDVYCSPTWARSRPATSPATPRPPTAGGPPPRPPPRRCSGCRCPRPRTPRGGVAWPTTGRRNGASTPSRSPGCRA